MFHISSPGLLDALALRDLNENRSMTAKRDLTRYYRLMAKELDRLGLHEDDLKTVAHAFHGRSPDPPDADFIIGALKADDAHGLARRLESITPGQALALIDAAERFAVQLEIGKRPQRAAETALGA
jgi:hypothetical protein